MKRQLLLVDDDQDAVLTLSHALALKLNNVKIAAASTTTKALDLAKELKPQVVICDLCIDTKIGVDSGFSLLKSLIEHDTNCRVIMLTGHSDKANGIRALELGATNFIAKPAELEHLLAICRDAFNQADLRNELAELRKHNELEMLSELAGNSSQIQELKQSIRFAAASSQSVLITGETGTGKGMCAQIIHNLSKRSGAKFVRYQPNFIAAEMVNSDLFGHVKGAFTGADNNRTGLLIDANNGTLFLDEIDELPKQTQVSLLGVLQDKIFRALGSNADLTSDFRLISACNKPIEDSIKSGLVREDFFHRIAHVRIHIPALRERKEDVLPLARQFMKTTAALEQLPVFEITQESESSLLNYGWPGNIRELQSQVQSAVFKAAFEGRTFITPTDFNFASKIDATTISPSDFNFSSLNYVDHVKAYKKALVEAALKQTNNNQVQAARLLGINRSTLKRAIEMAD